MRGTVTIEVAPGELIDKITILEIKAERITEADKLANVAIELETLGKSRDSALPVSADLTRLTADLKAVNTELWEVEDAIRDCERAGDFGPRFIELARAVYKTNDRRAAVKREINLAMGSHLVEEKSYRPY
jgi:post-segregation antitoxin (ccd killing protein)